MCVISELQEFYDKFKSEKGCIGFSDQGKPIYYFAVEKTFRPIVIVKYAICAGEHMITRLAIRQIKDFIASGKAGKVYFVPISESETKSLKKFTLIIKPDIVLSYHDSVKSRGGYTDWCAESLHIPSVTVKVGKDLSGVYEKNKNVIKTLTENGLWKNLWN